MKTLITTIALLSLTSLAAAAGVTPLQRQAAAKINGSAIAKRVGIHVKAGDMQLRLLDGAHGKAVASVKTKRGAFPLTVAVTINGRQLSHVTIAPAGAPGKAF